MRYSLLMPLAIALVPAFSFAQVEVKVEGAAAKKTKPALLAWTRYQDASKAYTKVVAEARKELQAAPRGDAAARKAFIAALTAPRKVVSEANDAFKKAFAASDFKSWDPTTYGKMLEAGLLGGGIEALDGHPARALEMFQTLLAKLPETRAAKQVKTYWLHTAYAAAGDFAGGIAYLQKAIDEASAQEKPGLLTNLGDLMAAQGDVTFALAQYQKAVAGLPETLARSDPRSRAKRNAELRLALLGKTAPEVNSSTWVGGTAKALSAHQGRVVVLDFWATWCGPCRHVMPALSRLYEAKKDQGLTILGVTRFYANGYMPANPQEMQSGGQSVRGMQPDAFIEHLTEFKKNSGISYPFVVGEKADFEHYHVSGIPTVVVVDATGKAAFVGVGSGSEPMLRAAVKAALARARKGE